MSTLKVNTLQDTSGSNSSTAEQIAQGRAKAWINFNGQGTIAIRNSFNVSSITGNGTGDTTVTLSTTQANTNYVVVANAGLGASYLTVPIHTKSTSPFSQAPTTTVFRFVTTFGGSASNVQDSQQVAVAVFGD